MKPFIPLMALTRSTSFTRPTLPTITVLGITSLLMTTMSLNANAHSQHKPHKNYAQVTQVTPIYEIYTVREPYKECHLEKRHGTNRTLKNNHPRNSHGGHSNTSATPIIIGALIGGAIGNELGHNKSNKRVGAVAGAILGGSIAHDLKANNNKHQPRQGHRNYTATEKVCTTHHNVRHEKHVTGYDVDYHYRGKTYSTVMNTHPGNRIRVAVDVAPIAY